MSERVPKPAFFADEAAAIADAEGVYLSDLAAGDVVDIETAHHLYTFLIIDPAAGRVEVMSNGTKIREPREMTLSGSLLGEGAPIRCRWIGIGYRLEFVDGEYYVRPTPTRSIAVNGARVLPRDPAAPSA